MRELFSRANDHADQRLADSALRPRPFRLSILFLFSRGDFFKIVWSGNGARSGYVNYITRCNLLQLGIEYKIWHQARNLGKT